MDLTTIDDRSYTGEEIAALVTIETAERLARKALLALQSDAQPDLRTARLALMALVDRTTTTTVSRVKNLVLSDGIAAAAAAAVKAVDFGATHEHVTHLELVDGEVRETCEDCGVIVSAGSPEDYPGREVRS